MPPPVFLLSRFFRLLQDQIHRLNIARNAMALDLCQTVGRLIGNVTILLAAGDIRNMHLYDRQRRDPMNCIPQSQAGMRIGTGIDHNPVIVLDMGFLNPVHQIPFMIRLPAIRRHLPLFASVSIR